jgi:ATP-dependent Clp protease ATP-binding subunit ClpX
MLQNQTSVIDRNNLMKYITPLDLKSFGLILKSSGRFPF